MLIHRGQSIFPQTVKCLLISVCQQPLQQLTGIIWSQKKTFFYSYVTVDYVTM